MELKIQTEIGEVTAQIDAYPDGFGCYYVGEIKEYHVIAQGDTLNDTLRQLQYGMDCTLEWNMDDLIKTLNLL